MAPVSVYVGGLGEDILTEDLEKEFGRFGNLTKVWVAVNPPRFAFINFENDDDASEAIKEMNGALLNGSKIRVDISHRSKRGRSYRFHVGRRGGSGGFGGRQHHSFVCGFKREGREGGRSFSQGGPKYGSGGYVGGLGFRSRSPIVQSSNNAWKPVGVLDCPELVKGFEDSSKCKSSDKKRKHSGTENICSVSVPRKKSCVEKLSDSVDNINNLPEEILIQIFQYFRRDELDCIAWVCKSWYRITRYPVLWKKVNVLFPKTKSQDNVISSFSENLPTCVTHLKLDFQAVFTEDCLKFERFCMMLKERCPSLKVLILHHIDFSVSLQAVIDLCSHYMQNLEILSIRYSTFTDYSVKAEYGDHSKIKLLDLYLNTGFGDYKIRTFSKMLSLKKLCLPINSVIESWFEGDTSFLYNLEVLNLQYTRIHSSTFQALKNHALKLTELYVCGTYVQDSDFLFNNSMLCQLKTVCLRNCSVTCEGIVSLIRSCHSLQNVYVDHEIAESYAQHPFVITNKCKLQIVKSAEICCHHVKDYLCEE